MLTSCWLTLLFHTKITTHMHMNSSLTRNHELFYKSLFLSANKPLLEARNNADHVIWRHLMTHGHMELIILMPMANVLYLMDISVCYVFHKFTVIAILTGTYSIAGCRFSRGKLSITLIGGSIGFHSLDVPTEVWKMGLFSASFHIGVNTSSW